jgi:hypothetical protein
MTKTQAVLLQRRWKRQGHPLCEHWVQELASSDFDQGHVLNAYHCRVCGELLIDQFKAKSMSNSPSIKPEYVDEL